MIPYIITSSTDNAYNSTYYDPRFDGSLRFKLYFRTNFNSELVNNADFTNVKFKNAYLGYAAFNGNNYILKTNLTNISLSIKFLNNEALIIAPTSWSD